MLGTMASGQIMCVTPLPALPLKNTGTQSQPLVSHLLSLVCTSDTQTHTHTRFRKFQIYYLPCIYAESLIYFFKITFLAFGNQIV